LILILVVWVVVGIVALILLRAARQGDRTARALREADAPPDEGTDQ
jgi:hypothetical protein